MAEMPKSSHRQWFTLPVTEKNRQSAINAFIGFLGNLSELPFLFRTKFKKKLQFCTQNNIRPVRSAYQPPASSTFLSERTSHQQSAATSQQYSSLRTNQHQPSATSQPNRL
jgi:hypothetical protein